MSAPGGLLSKRPGRPVAIAVGRLYSYEGSRVLREGHEFCNQFSQYDIPINTDGWLYAVSNLALAMTHNGLGEHTAALTVPLLVGGTSGLGRLGRDDEGPHLEQTVQAGPTPWSGP